MILALLLAASGSDVRICDKSNATLCVGVSASGGISVTGSGTFDISDRVGRALGVVTIGAGAAAIGSITNTTFGATQGTSPWVTADNHTTAAAPLSLRLSDGAAFYNTNTAAQLPAALDGSGFLKVHEQGTATVTGTVTTTPPANASTNVAQLAGTTTDTNSGSKSAGTLRVVLATDQPALTNKLLVTPDSVALPANQSVNVTQWSGTASVTGSGTATGALRVELANNGAGLVGLNAGSALVGKVGIDQTTMGTTNGVVPVGTTVAAAAVASQKMVAVNTTTNVKASAGNVYGLSCANANASICWVQFYNTAGSPTCGTAVIWAVAMPSSGTVTIPPGALALANHATGVGMCMGTTATGATACTTANACTIFYQ